MAYLQLAEGTPYQHLAANVAANTDKYIFIPQGFRGAAKDAYVREDVFDNLGDQEYQQLMFELAPYQNTGLSDKASRKERRTQRLDAKKEKVSIRQAGKTERVKAGGGVAGIIGKVGDVAKSILAPGSSVDVNAGGTQLQIQTDGGEPTFWEKNKMLIIGGTSLVVLGGIAYAVSRSKKNKRK